ncbi:MAG: universal stress protein [Bacteroidota bacterium]|jgi:nucleotide-binding universal stress UspA family protein
MIKKTILVALDYHKASQNALQYALNLAYEMKSELFLLHAFHVPVPTMDTSMPIQSNKEVQNFENKRIDRVIKSTLENFKYKIKINGKAIEGLAGEIIPSWIKKHKPNLTIMGIHSVGALDEFLLGSTCESIIREDLVPVLIIPSNVKFKKINRITFSTDLKEINTSYITEKLKYYCNLFSASLHILHINEPNGLVFSEEKENLEKIKEEFSKVKIKISEPESKKITDIILNEGLKNNSRWIVLIHKNYGLLKEIFHKSIIKKMIFHSEIPILVLNSGKK